MEYQVSIDNEEINRNANSLSLTGRVNGINVAKVIRLSAVESCLTEKEKKREKQMALIDAYLGRMVPNESAPGEKVSL